MPDTAILVAVFSTLGSFAGSATVSYLTHRFRASQKAEEREREAQYLAIQLTCELDAFVDNCCDVFTDDGELNETDERQATVKLPELAYPPDAEWKSLHPDIMYRAISFPSLIRDAAKAIGQTLEHAASAPDYDEWFQERAVQFAELGVKALKLSDDLRARYDIPTREAGSWDSRKAIVAYMDKAQKMKLIAAKSRAETWDWLVKETASPTPSTTEK